MTAPANTSGTDSTTGPLAQLTAAGVLDDGDCLVATRIARLVGEEDDAAVLALALAVRAAREGSGALHLDSVARLTPHPNEHDTDDNDQQDADPAAEPTTLADVIDLPEPQAWLQAVAASRLAARGVLHIEFGLVQLDRYRADERLIAGWLDSRSPDRLKSVEATALEERSRPAGSTTPRSPPYALWPRARPPSSPAGPAQARRGRSPQSCAPCVSRTGEHLASLSLRQRARPPPV